MMARAWGEEYRTTTVCVDSYENGVLNGRFYNSYFDQGKQFRSTIEFLTEMEQALDTMDFPKAFTVTRTFAPPQEKETCILALNCQTGKRGTFSIRVLFRQNASWQGTVTWMEGKREQSFRSVLELLLLMDNALNIANENVS